MTRDQEACGLIQTRHTVPGSILYHSYWYRSGINRTMTANLHGIAQAAEELVGLSPGDLVVDIGCNDGTLLDGYTAPNISLPRASTPRTSSRYAVEKGYDVVNDFFSAGAVHRAPRRPQGQGRHLASRCSTTSSTRATSWPTWPRCSPSDGVWVMELHYLPLMLEMNSFDAIVHEHLEYYSLAVLERLFAEEGLEVVARRAERHQRRLDPPLHRARRQARAHARADDRSIQALRIREFELALDAAEPYEEFRRNSEQVRDELVEGPARPQVTRARRSTSTAPRPRATRSSSTPGIDSALISHAADRNPDKWGSETIAHAHPDHQRGGVPRDEARTTTSRCHGTSSTSSSSARRSSSSAAAASSCRCPTCASSPSRPPGRKVRACQRGMWPSSASGVSACRWRSRSPAAASTWWAWTRCPRCSSRSRAGACRSRSRARRSCSSSVLAGGRLRLTDRIEEAAECRAHRPHARHAGVQPHRDRHLATSAASPTTCCRSCMRATR